MESNDIAIISLSSRFPSCDNTKLFWDMLIKNKMSIKEIDRDTLRKNGCEHYLDYSNYVNKCSVINNPELFDAEFFNMNPAEAILCDPQQRLFLHCCLEALDLAGHPNPENQGIRTGVFAGCSLSTYFIFNLLPSEEIMKRDQTQLIMSTASDFLATRVAYKLNLKGPALTIQTACSTSLVAIHQACQSLLSGEIDLALAGGASVSAFRETGYFYKPEGIRSIDGLCRPFDKEASGTIFGDGVGVIALCRLEDAIGNGNHVYAIIKSSAVNNDGDEKAGYTAPSINGQMEVIRESMALAQIKSEQMSFVEAHGTATKIGDPIEFKALTLAYDTDKRRYCALGSVKSNVGHLDAASGVAGLIKATLSLHNRIYPATLNYHEANSDIDVLNSPFFICDRNLSLNSSEKLFAGISSFGIGGTNAHIILSNVTNEIDKRKNFYIKNTEKNLPNIYIWSDRTDSSLDKLILDNINFIIGKGSNFNDEEYSYSLTQKHYYDFRACLVSEKNALPFDKKNIFRHKKLKNTKSIFLFSGCDDVDWSNLVKELYENNEIFKIHVDDFSEIFYKHYLYDIKEKIYSRDIKLKHWNKLALFVFITGIVKVLEDYNIEIDLLIGEGFSRLIVAYVSKAISKENIVELIIAYDKLTNKYDKLTESVSIEELDEWKEIISRIKINPLQCSVVSYSNELNDNILLKNNTYSVNYLVNFIKHKRLLSKDISNIITYYKNKDINPIFIEIGSDNFLKDAIKSDDSRAQFISITNENGRIDFLSFYNAVAKLWVYGLDLNLNKLIPKTNIIPTPISYLDLKPYWFYPIKSEKKIINDASKILIENKKEINLIGNRNLLEEIILNIFRETLMHENFNITDNFFEAGGDSISALEISRKLEQYGLDITTKTIFELQNIEKIICFLEKDRPTKKLDIDNLNSNNTDIDNQEDIEFIMRQIDLE